MALAEQAGILGLADEDVSVPNDSGAHAGRKLGSLVAGMVAGAKVTASKVPGTATSGFED